MNISADLFEAFLKCPTKCWLRAAGESGSGNDYAEWVKSQTASYRATQIELLLSKTPKDKSTVSPALENFKAGKWNLVIGMVARAQLNSCALESELHAVERVPPEGRGRPAQFIPIRFIFTNKLSNDDKLLLAFEAFVFSEVMGREVSLGTINHGDDHTTLKVKVAALAGEVRKYVEKIVVLLSSQSPPDLVLNRHCAGCEFQARCRQKAVEQDDLSLISGMTGLERKKLNSKGIFTVKQFSYAFLPRRRPKSLRQKREKYHHSLKALAIREKKIHIVGNPELKIEGTPVYLDVEGLPDRDFYYLIGLRMGLGKSVVQHSLWADRPGDEAKIYAQFLDILSSVEKPLLIHYGSFETHFFEQMGKRYGTTVQNVLESNGNQAPVDTLSIVVGQIYFPTYSNSLKDIASWLGFVWSESSPMGLNSIACRCAWEVSRDSSMKTRLLTYNAEDCQATEIVTETLLRLHAPDPWNGSGEKPPDAVNVESLKKKHRKFGPFVSPFKEFERVALAAWWDYERDRIYVRSSKPVKRIPSQPKRSRLGPRSHFHVNKTIVYPGLSTCPFCGGQCEERNPRTRMLYDLFFGRYSVKRWVVRCRFHYYWCHHCSRRFGEPHEFWPQSHLGRNLVAFVLYQTIDLYIPFPTVKKMLSRCFNLDMQIATLMQMKETAAQQYKSTYESILHHLVTGRLLHADETQVSIRGKTAYVWVFTNLYDVAYLYTESREGTFLQEMLKDFKGVLISDFFAAYDSLGCEQQKCLIHLMRDLNDAVLEHPYDEALKVIVGDFAALLKPIVETIDRRGLKRRFLGKHRGDVNRFYRKLAKLDSQSEQANKCKQRFEKNRDKLFTFLNHDSIPWHNNNAEHAVKAFAKIRDIVRGSFTERTVRNNLVLLSICQTCKYSGMDFFEFLCSGETGIYAFGETGSGRKRWFGPDRCAAPYQQ